MRFLEIKDGFRNTSITAGAAVFLLLFGMESAALAASSWSRQPAWASTIGDSPTRKPSARREEPQTAPFAPGSNNLAVDIGQVFLMGDLSSNYMDSIGSQVHYTYGVSEMFGFDTSFGYSSHSNDGDGKYSLASLLAGLRTNLSWYDRVIPHAVFGLGFYRPSYTFGTESFAPVVFGLHLGPGVDLELTRQLFFGAALTFHDVFGTTVVRADKSKFDVGGTYTTFFLRVGFTF